MREGVTPFLQSGVPGKRRPGLPDVVLLCPCAPVIYFDEFIR